jgi:hypothetical protein
MCGAVVFCPIVCTIGVAWAPEVSELLLRLRASKPMEMHVHCFCLLRLDVIIDDAECRAVVGLYWHWGLLVSHFFKCVSLGDGLTGVDVQCTKFGFGGGGYDGLDELGKVEGRAIVFGVSSVGGQEKVSAGVAACFGFDQIGGIAVHDKHHVTPPVSDDGILVCGGEVKELFALLHGVFGGFCLGRGYCAEHREHGGVDCPSIVEEDTYHILDEFLLGG